MELRAVKGHIGTMSEETEAVGAEEVDGPLMSKLETTAGEWNREVVRWSRMKVERWFGNIVQKRSSGETLISLCTANLPMEALTIEVGQWEEAGIEGKVVRMNRHSGINVA